MNILSNRTIVFALKFYVGAALIITAVFSSPATSVAAVLTLLLYLFLQWRPFHGFIKVISSYFVFFAIAILLAPIIGVVLSGLVALPVLFLITNSLMVTAVSFTIKPTGRVHSLTQEGIVLSSLMLANLLIALFLGSLSLILASSLAILHLGILVYFSITRVSAASIKVEQIKQRMVAGTSADLAVNLHSKTGIGGILHIESPYEWLKIHSPVIELTKGIPVLKFTISPLLSGPSEIMLQACVIDRWGLTQVRFQLSPVKLHVIPRARYASWLAKKYLEATKPGNLPIISNISAIRPQFGLRRGVEYYGSQTYQPGDELRSIDWKHSVKYNKMITKEFIEFHGQPAMLLVNLSIKDAEEADELAQKIIMTALSLAQEQIPTVIAAYDHNDIKLVTPTLQPQQMVVRSLEITKGLTFFDNPTRYLYSPDVNRLKADINRLGFAESEASRTLSQLMKIEYKNLVESVVANPATRAINKALESSNTQSTIVVVSRLNHDANAVAVNSYLMARRGYSFVAI